MTYDKAFDFSEELHSYDVATTGFRHGRTVSIVAHNVYLKDVDDTWDVIQDHGPCVRDIPDKDKALRIFNGFVDHLMNGHSWLTPGDVLASVEFWCGRYDETARFGGFCLEAQSIAPCAVVSLRTAIDLARIALTKTIEDKPFVGVVAALDNTGDAVRSELGFSGKLLDSRGFVDDDQLEFVISLIMRDVLRMATQAYKTTLQQMLAMKLEGYS